MMAGFGSGPLVLRRRPRRPPRIFHPFPRFAETGVYGVGTYQLGPENLLDRALAGGAALIDTSPDYREGAIEDAVGRAVERAGTPVFLMTQIPAAAWEAENRKVAFERALRQSLGRLRRERVEALLVRNAEPEQLRDPEFRVFATEALEHGQVGMIGASGHGPDMERVLEAGKGDALLSIFLLAAPLARFRSIPEHLTELRQAGKVLVTMKCREDAFWRKAPGWEREAARFRHRPWDSGWEPGFSREALRHGVTAIPAENAVVGLRHPEDVPLVLDREG